MAQNNSLISAYQARSLLLAYDEELQKQLKLNRKMRIFGETLRTFLLMNTGRVPIYPCLAVEQSLAGLLPVIPGPLLIPPPESPHTYFRIVRDPPDLLSCILRDLWIYDWASSIEENEFFPSTDEFLKLPCVLMSGIPFHEYPLITKAITDKGLPDTFIHKILPGETLSMFLARIYDNADKYVMDCSLFAQLISIVMKDGWPVDGGPIILYRCTEKRLFY